MKKALSEFFVGLIFGFGLLLSGMTNPAKVIGFLNVTGSWDPSLAFVMGGAIAVGHPLASSGIRLMAYLARGFELDPSVRYGLTTMCIGLGMGGTVIWENPHFEGAAA